MGDRATPALIALDPAAEGSEDGIAPNISALVAQPAVTGPLLDFVAGFVREGFEDAFGTAEPEQERVVTAIGEAIRFRFVIPSESITPLVATTWVVGAAEGTLLISVIGPADGPSASDPDSILEAAVPLDWARPFAPSRPRRPVSPPAVRPGGADNWDPAGGAQPGAPRNDHGEPCAPPPLVVIRPRGTTSNVDARFVRTGRTTRGHRDRSGSGGNDP